MQKTSTAQDCMSNSVLTAGLGWDMRCMAGVLLGAGIAMADLIRQAEGACAERGTALVAAWNLHTSICDSMMGM